MRVEFFTRERCGLCDEARAVLKKARARHGFELVETDIDTDPLLRARFRYDVPVVVIGKTSFRHRLDEELLDQALSSTDP